MVATRHIVLKLKIQKPQMASDVCIGHYRHRKGSSIITENAVGQHYCRLSAVITVIF